jgi:hypothetical protein
MFLQMHFYSFAARTLPLSVSWWWKDWRASKWANTGYGAGALVAPYNKDLLGYAPHVKTPKMGRFMLFLQAEGYCVRFPLEGWWSKWMMCTSIPTD